jgi:hypothetical protein
MRKLYVDTEADLMKNMERWSNGGQDTEKDNAEASVLRRTTTADGFTKHDSLDVGLGEEDSRSVADKQCCDCEICANTGPAPLGNGGMGWG